MYIGDPYNIPGTKSKWQYRRYIISFYYYVRLSDLRTWKT